MRNGEPGADGLGERPGSTPGFGGVVRAHRRRLGLTQDELADKTGLSVRAIGKLETGRITTPRPATVRLLADALGLVDTDRNAFQQAADDAAGGPATSPVPSQLPSDTSWFTGQAEHLDTLDALRSRDAAAAVVIAVTGAAGTGKTTLAIHWAHRAKEDFPDGQIFLDLRGFTPGAAPVPPASALERLLRTMGVAGDRIPAAWDDRAALWRSLLAERRLLIVLDNAAAADQVQPLLPGSPGSLVLVTSRRRMASLEPTLALTVDALPAADAITLFTRAAGTGRAADHTGSVADVVELCGRLPLAIRIAAARLRSHPAWHPSHLADRLRGQGERLAELVDEDGSRSVTTALDVSYRQLSTDQQALYRRLSQHPGLHFEPYATAALVGTEVPTARRLLGQLLDAYLLQELSPDRYVFHDLVREHAAAAAAREEPMEGLRAALRRLLDHYRHTVSVSTDSAYPYARSERPRIPPASTPTPEVSSPHAARGWLDAELPNVYAAAFYAADNDWPEHLLHLAYGIQKHLQVRGNHDDSQALHDTCLAIARKTGDRISEMRALAGLAWISTQRGDYASAVDGYQQVLELAAASDDQISKVYGRAGLTEVLLRQGRYGAALANAEAALPLAQRIRHGAAEARVRNLLGHLHYLAGQLEPASEHFGHSLEVAGSVGDSGGALYARLGLGNVDKRRGSLETARTHFQRALAAAHAIGNPTHIVSSLLGLGDVCHRQGQHRSAVEHCQQALDLAQETDHRYGMCEASQALGRLHHSRGEPGSALAYHERALTLASGLGQGADQARAHDGIAHTRLAIGQPALARQHWERALAILSGLGTDHTPDETANAPAIRAHLAALDYPA